MLVSKTTVDWFKWARIKTIILDDACGLLAGIDLSEHRWIRNNWEEQANLYKNQNDRPDRGYMDSWRKELDDNVDELIKKQKIMEVVQNHINEGCFIPMKLKEISEKEFKKSHPFEEIPEGEKAGYWTVNLAEFGTWAKSAGFDLPPEFPVSNSTTELDSQKLEIYPDLKKYSLKQASEIITNISKNKHTKKNLIELAIDNKLNISFHKPDWAFLRIDKPDYEMEVFQCDLLGAGLVIPKDGKHLRGQAPLYEGDIFPFIQANNLKILLKEKTILINSHNFKAHDNEKISVSVIERKLIPTSPEPSKTNPSHDLYYPFNNCIAVFFKGKGNKEPIDVSKYHEETIYYQLKSMGVSADMVFIEKEDLCITKHELQAYIDSLPPSQKQQAPIKPVQAPEPIEKLKLNNKEKPKAREVIEGLKSISDTQPVIDDTKLIEGMKALIIFIYGEQPEQKQIVNDLALKGVNVSRQVVGKYLKIAFDT